MADELTEKWSNFRLMEEKEDDVVIDKDWILDPECFGKSYLIGKLVVKKRFNLEAMRNVLCKAWRLKEEMVVKEVGIKYSYSNSHAIMTVIVFLLSNPGLITSLF
ncbi:hypothetical protein PTKIN_Ptkin03bG0002200 [Pterospermum kingtungense]